MGNLGHPQPKNSHWFRLTPSTGAGFWKPPLTPIKCITISTSLGLIPLPSFSSNWTTELRWSPPPIDAHRKDHSRQIMELENHKHHIFPTNRDLSTYTENTTTPSVAITSWYSLHLKIKLLLFPALCCFWSNYWASCWTSNMISSALSSPSFCVRWRAFLHISIGNPIACNYPTKSLLTGIS